MKRWLTGLLFLAALQAALVAGWWLVERGRGDPDPGVVAPARLEAAARTAPELRFRRRDASEGTLQELSGRPAVVHFWATWCPPCREELPALLRWAATSDAEVLVVSVDPGWGAVESFFGGAPPAGVVLADADAARRWGADALPATFLVNEAGRITHVAQGPLDWRGAGPLRAIGGRLIPGWAPGPRGTASGGTR